MSQMMDPQLLAGLQGQGQPGQEQGGDPLGVLQEVIQMMPHLMSTLPDPRDTQDVARALLILTTIQSRLMGNGPQGSA
jgi:hypothetical protein